ncbi:MAG: RNA polymerase sigma factor [Hyphomonadaceae bacterium]
MTAADTHRAVLAVWRTEQQRLVAILSRMLRDVPLAEEFAQEALLAALETWPERGVPDQPAAWLITTAKRRALDHIRRDQMLARKHQTLLRDLESEQETMPGPDAHLDDDMGDDILRLVFTACHPILAREQRTALTLRMVGGLTTEEIARAFLATTPAIQQRIVRAKRTLSESGLAYETPHGPELAQRLQSVLEVLYLIFNEGYAATSGEDLMRPQLCDEALRLARILAALMPNEPEAHGLLGLMELHASRAPARTDANGDPILLLDQNRLHWDRLLIRRGLAALERAQQLGGGDGFYTLQATILAVHARTLDPAETNWREIANTYATLYALTRSPVVALNQAIALGMAEGPATGLALLDSLADHPALKAYHLYPASRADMLEKLGRKGEAAAEFQRAATLATNDRERAFLTKRAEANS